MSLRVYPWDDGYWKELAELSKTQSYILYNADKDLIAEEDIYFFSSKKAAIKFQENNIDKVGSFTLLSPGKTGKLYNHNLPTEIINKQINNHLNKKPFVMNEKNIEYLENQLKYSGFPETMNEQLRNKIAGGETDFVLGHENTYGNDEIAAALHFRKADNSDMYFFNRYSLMLKNEHYPEPIKQTFYMNHMQDNITLKEAYNMMSGRAVYKELQNKEGEKYNAWIQLDFKQTEASGNYKIRPFNDKWGFKLEEMLAKYPITALKNEDEKKMLIQSLERGNRQSVMFEADGKEVRVFIEASPQHHGLNFYDQHMKKGLPHELTAKEGQEKKNGMKQKNDGDDDLDKRKRGVKQKV